MYACGAQQPRLLATGDQEVDLRVCGADARGALRRELRRHRRTRRRCRSLRATSSPRSSRSASMPSANTSPPIPTARATRRPAAGEGAGRPPARSRTGRGRASTPVAGRRRAGETSGRSGSSPGVRRGKRAGAARRRADARHDVRAWPPRPQRRNGTDPRSPSSASAAAARLDSAHPRRGRRRRARRADERCSEDRAVDVAEAGVASEALDRRLHAALRSHRRALRRPGAQPASMAGVGRSSTPGGRSGRAPARLCRQRRLAASTLRRGVTTPNSSKHTRGQRPHAKRPPRRAAF